MMYVEQLPFSQVRYPKHHIVIDKIVFPGVRVLIFNNLSTLIKGSTDRQEVLRK